MKSTAIAKITAKLSDGSLIVEILSGRYAGSENVVENEARAEAFKALVGKRLKVELERDQEDILIVKKAWTAE